MTTTGHLTKLVALAHEKSSARRLELLREITDLFMEEPAMRSGAAGEQAGAILTTVASQVEERARARLAERFADSPEAPKPLVRALALDTLAVAQPLLERSPVLDEDAMLDVVRARGAGHQAAIAGRPAVPQSVAEALVSRGEPDVLVCLASNKGAQLSRKAMEGLVDTAEKHAALHAPIAGRADFSPDLLNELFLFTSRDVRETISERLDALDPEAFDAAVRAAKERLAKKSGPRPGDYEEAVRFIQAKKLRKGLDGALLLTLLERGERTRYLVAFADLAGLDYAASVRVNTHRAVDPLAIACCAAGFKPDLFVALALLRPVQGPRSHFDADVLRQIYEILPKEAAERAMRFWRVREASKAGTPPAAHVVSEGAGDGDASAGEAGDAAA